PAAAPAPTRYDAGRRSGKVVAADRMTIHCRSRRRRLRPRIELRRGLAQGRDECDQDRQRHDLVAGFGDLVEAGGKRPLVRERTAPFAAVVDKTTKPP